MESYLLYRCEKRVRTQYVSMLRMLGGKNGMIPIIVSTFKILSKLNVTKEESALMKYH